MTARFAVLPIVIEAAALGVIFFLAPPAGLARQWEDLTSELSSSGDAQSWERALGLQDEFLVQLALARGLDPVRAEQLRDLYQERRRSPRYAIGETAAGRMNRQDLRVLSARARTKIDEQVRALLTPEEIGLLDDEEARVQAVAAIGRINASVGERVAMPTSQGCAMEDAIYGAAAPNAVGDWRMEFDSKPPGGELTARIAGPFAGGRVELGTSLFDVKGGASYRIGDALAIFFDERLVSVSPMPDAPTYMFVYGLTSELGSTPVRHRNVGIGDPMWRLAGCQTAP
jgi:hypothetical protein